MSRPPVGDNQWKLYHLRDDPGEVNDVQKQHPQLFLLMQKEYADYEKANGVLPMPEGYDPVRQVLINSMINYWLPTYAPVGIGATLLLLGLGWFWIKRRKSHRLA